MEVLDRPAWNPARQCTATARGGTRCRRQPIPGGSVCIMHGGGAEQVQKSAKARLLAGADLAIDYLLNLLTPKPPCVACGRCDADRDPVVVRACQLVLDRSGFHPTLTIEQAPPLDVYEDLTVDEVIEKLEGMLAGAIAMRDEERAKSLPEATDGVLIGDDAFILPDDDETEDSQSPGDRQSEVDAQSPEPAIHAHAEQIPVANSYTSDESSPNAVQGKDLADD
jgi:hypothetical protein